MPRDLRWWPFAVGGLVVLVVAIVWATQVSMQHGAWLTVEEVDSSSRSLVLDEERVRQEMPCLADALDQAHAQGRATVYGTDCARGSNRYLESYSQREHHDSFSGTAQWRGKHFFVGVITE